jgi:predicted O-linked N-acetylglucosamine transferase (SPINDLY family)
MISVRQTLDAAWQHFRQGEWQQAEQLFLQILDKDPEQSEALHPLALIAGQTGRESLAIHYLEAVLRIQPELAAAHYNLGNLQIAQRKHSEAVDSYRRALLLAPDLSEAHNNLGNALGELGALAEAEASLRQAQSLKPDHAEAAYNLAIVLWKQGRLDEAVASLQHALRLRPEYPEAQVYLGNFYKEQGRLDEAIAAYRAALQLQPDAAHIHSNLILTLHYQPGYDAEAIYQECRRWNQQHAEPLQKFILPHPNTADPQRKLRIGYMSAHFCEHSDSLFTVPLLSNHDHQSIATVCYADVARPDALTHRLYGYFDVWRSTAGLSDEQAAGMVRSDQIDILVDLEMHMGNNRLLVFARKPAPVQVSWLGCTGTTGLSTIDFRLTDPYLDPPGLFDRSYSEETIRLPETFWCYDPLDGRALPVGPLPALETGVITLGCLNNFCKINDGCLALWTQVLRAVPQSRLLLLAPRGQTRECIAARFDQAGIARARVEFADWRPRLEYLLQYNQIDFCLDPLPCGGHTTSLDALWMGVPIVTLVGSATAFGRAGWSQLSNLGLHELAAETPEQYVSCAIQLASDLPRLQALRRTLRQRMQESPLMDGQRFARNVEQAYRQMWITWCRRR